MVELEVFRFGLMQAPLCNMHPSFRRLLTHLVDHVPDWRALPWDQKKTEYDRVLEEYHATLHRNDLNLCIQFEHEADLTQFVLTWS